MENNWSVIIKPKTKLLDVNIRELWQYRDLIWMFVERDYKTMYKQTILGPLWIILNPLLTTGMFTIVFGKIADIPTDGIPQFVFYMAGNILWSYFSACVDQTSKTFVHNAALFGKVYFPRLVIPISKAISGLINFMVQFVLFLGLVFFYGIRGGSARPGICCLLTPLLLVMLAMLSLGFGIIVSSLTTKYRDLTVLVTFGVQLWMYATPIVYPVSQIPEKLKIWILLNPVTPIVETFRYAFLGGGCVPWIFLGISFFIICAVLLIGIILFNRVQRTFMDTV